MKLLGLQRIAGGLAVALPSGEQTLLALPEDRRQAAEMIGTRILELLEDPTQPHCQSSHPSQPPGPASADLDEDDPFAALDAGLEAGRLLWRSLQRVSRGGRR